MSGGIDPHFSFAHRRLNEYFVARGLLNDPTSVALQAIPTDSRYRDALALYCEVGEAGQIKDIAAFCWREIVAVRPDSATAADHLRAVHCLRFLRDAFRTRPESIEFVAELAGYINQRLQPGGDLLAAKIALEATGLLPEDEAEPILVKALRMHNPWISETALHACRHLKRVGPQLDQGLFRYLRSIPIREFLHRNREIVFSLSLSDAFQGLRRYCVFRSIDTRTFVAAGVLCVLTSPIAGIAFVLIWTMFNRIVLATIRGVPVQILLRGYLAFLITTMSFNIIFRPPESQTLKFAHLLLPGLGFVHGSAHPYVIAVYMVIGLAIAPCVEMAFLLRRVSWRIPSLKYLIRH
jgi:hypothetical protein